MRRHGRRITFVDELLDPVRGVQLSDLTHREDRIRQLAHDNLALQRQLLTARRVGFCGALALVALAALGWWGWHAWRGTP